MKPTWNILFVFIILNFIPFFWINQIEFDIGKFTTEFYKYLYNAFFWGGILSVFFKSEIKAYLDNKEELRLKKKLILILKKIKDRSLDDRTFLQLSRDGYKLAKKINFSQIDLYEKSTLLKHLSFINTVSLSNINLKKETLDYQEAINYLKTTV